MAGRHVRHGVVFGITTPVRITIAGWTSAGPDIERGCGSPQARRLHSISLKLGAAYANNLHSDRPVASLERYAWQIVFTYLLSRPGWGAIRTEWCEERHDMPRASRGKSFSSGSMNESSSGGYRAGQDRRQLMRRRIR